MSFDHTFGQLKAHLAEVGRRNSHLKTDDAFAYWFAQAMLQDPDDNDGILRSLSGRSFDKNIDIVSFSPTGSDIYLCQTKFRHSLRKSAEPRNELNALARVASAFKERKFSSFMEFFPEANRDLEAQLRKAHGLYKQEKARLKIVYVSTGRIPRGAIDEAAGIVDHSGTRAEFLAYDGADCCRLFEDFQSLVPVVPYVELVSIGNPAQTESDRGRLKSYVFPAPAKVLASVVQQHGERLFARNIRLSKGEKAKVNREIARGLRETPEDFFCLNNGITMIATDARVEVISSTKSQLRIQHPQIINGQQTSRAIARESPVSGSPEVLVKLICTKPESDADLKRFRGFVRRVVRATNSQTPVRMSELASNDPEHIELERAFRLRRWRYVRKVGRHEKRHQQSWWGGAE